MTSDIGRPYMRQELTAGVVGGIVAGLVFALFEMVMAAILEGGNAFFMPLRMIGGIALGQEALDPSYSLVTAGLTGVLVHMVLAVIYGVIFAYLIAMMPQLAQSVGSVVVVGIVYGLLLWVVNFYVIAPLFGWNWFPQNTNPVVQIFAHGLFFGAVLAYFLARADAFRRPINE